MYETFDHTADIGLRIRAATLNDLFCEAGLGLFSLIVENISDVQRHTSVEFNLLGRKNEYDFLFFDWLNELLFTFETRQIVLAHFDVRISPSGLHAVVQGEPLDRARHRLEHEVKAITYHDLQVVQDSNGWLAKVILDI